MFADLWQQRWVGRRVSREGGSRARWTCEGKRGEKNSIVFRSGEKVTEIPEASINATSAATLRDVDGRICWDPGVLSPRPSHRHSATQSQRGRIQNTFIRGFQLTSQKIQFQRLRRQQSRSVMQGEEAVKAAEVDFYVVGKPTITRVVDVLTYAVRSFSWASCAPRKPMGDLSQGAAATNRPNNATTRRNQAGLSWIQVEKGVLLVFSHNNLPSRRNSPRGRTCTTRWLVQHAQETAAASPASSASNSRGTSVVAAVWFRFYGC